MARDPAKNTPGLVIKRHNIRIWCHDCDMARLQRVVWEGHGSRLLSEVSNQPIVKRFLEAVPYIMNTVRDIHQAVVQNDLESVMKNSSDPVPPQILSSRDSNNMTVMHKAAGLGHSSILKYLVERYPQGINDIDNDGRTPLHYAASMRDEQHTYNLLVDLGADESVVDNKNKTPAYYINRPQEIDKSLFKNVPDAPRTASNAYPSNWDWKLLDNDVIADLNKKSRRRNLKASTENLLSKNYSNTISESTDNRNDAMKPSSTHEFIKDLPDLDDTNKENKDETEESNEEEGIKKESDDNEVNNGEDQINENNENEEKREIEETEVAEENHNIENVNDGVETHNDEESNDASKNQDTEQNENDIKKQANDEKTESTENVEVIHNSGEDSTEKESEKAKPTESTAHDTENKGSSEENIEPKEAKSEQTSDNTEGNTANTEQNTENTERKTETVEHDTTNINDNTESTVQITEISDVDKENTDKTENNHNIDNIEHIEDKADKLEENTENLQTNEYKTEKNGANDTTKDENTLSESTVVRPKTATKVPAATELSSGNNDTHEDDVNKSGHVINGRNTQESLIEGIISGEAEQDSQDASITQGKGSIQREVLVVDNEIDPEVTDLINNANMEMLATLVLNGEGARLMGRHSENLELQAFLDNVPTYMQKINKVHIAAKEGNIRDLQSALDRRKFAIARDPISANGATPLHVATVFGKTNIIKYLGGRFPETLSSVDFEGRTALHYAAVLPDNGHYYTLLQQLGANSKDLDDNGRSAEDYFKNPYLLPFEHLLSDFGLSEEEVKSMFSDKGTSIAANGHMDIPIFKTEEGRYLAQSLGDPLIKGLTEVANVKPKDPVAFLASFLQNFPESEKPTVDTEETNMVLTEEVAEVENEEVSQESTAETVAMNGSRSGARTTTRSHRPIDVVTVDPQTVVSPDAPETAFSSANRDEHGQSMLHFAAARTHARNALFQLLQESEISLAYRDELYRTARDVSIQANVPENTAEIDKWVLHLAAKGNTEKMMGLLLEGYDHILDVVDEEGVPITDVVTQRGDTEMSKLLESIPTFEESRDNLHGAVRRGDLSAIRDLVLAEGGRTLARSQNSFGRTALHIAVLVQHEDIVAYLAQTCPELLRIGDNLERTPLHYAMGVEKIESLSRILIRAGAKRVLKDLKGRQPSYYFMNKSDILRLKEEEEVY